MLKRDILHHVEGRVVSVWIIRRKMPQAVMSCVVKYIGKYAVGDGLSEVIVRPRLLARQAVGDDSSASQK